MSSAVHTRTIYPTSIRSRRRVIRGPVKDCTQTQSVDQAEAPRVSRPAVEVAEGLSGLLLFVVGGGVSVAITTMLMSQAVSRLAEFSLPELMRMISGAG